MIKTMQHKLGSLDHSKYQPEAAAYLFRLCQLAYQGRDEANKASIRMGFGDAVLHSVGSAQFLVCRGSRCSVVAFAGTNEWNDWYINAAVGKREFLDLGMAHAGFVAEVTTVARQIAVSNSLPVLITGHSKGGAEAVLEAALRRYHRNRVDACYTFGSPRVFSPLAAFRYDRTTDYPTFRVTVNNDPVPRMPTRRMDYKHVGEHHYFNRRCQRVAFPGWWYVLFDRIAGRVRGGVLDGIRDHRSDSYNRCLMSDWLGG